MKNGFYLGGLGVARSALAVNRRIERQKVNSTILIALGNPLMSDEGVGVRVLSAVRDLAPEGVEFLDSGNSGMRILHALSDRRRAVFVDCAYMDEPPGTLRVFTPGEVASRKVLPRLSLHEGDLLQTLEMAERLGILPSETILLGIQPDSVGPGLELSSVLVGKFDSYVKTALSALRDGIEQP